MELFPDGAAIVFGGSGGIGSAICQKLAHKGTHVVVTYYRNSTAAEELVSAIKDAGYSAHKEAIDITRYEAVEALYSNVKEKYGAIHTVIYASGPAFKMNFISNIDPAEWRRVLDQDVNGCFNVIRASLPFLREAKGSIIAVTTCALSRVPVADILSAAPKSAIEVLVRGVAKEEGRYGVRANCVGPGWINAGIGARALETKLTDKDKQNILKSIPMGQIGNANDIAEAVTFLASSKARYITGQSLDVDGGLQL